MVPITWCGESFGIYDGSVAEVSADRLMALVETASDSPKPVGPSAPPSTVSLTSSPDRSADQRRPTSLPHRAGSNTCGSIGGSASMS